jgi:serine/threonine-protein kinase
VFEYIDGANVRDIIYANGPLPLADALNYTLQIANALTHAWEREVVHRDIKPSNILITQDGLASWWTWASRGWSSSTARQTTKRPPA